MARNETVIATNLPYSPDLASFDFDLFGHVKDLLRRESFETGERLLLAIEGIVRFLEKSTLTKVFLEWMTRLEWCIETNGDYAG
jgi:hypothetical protein